jgi:hypothetical protein
MGDKLCSTSEIAREAVHCNFISPIVRGPTWGMIVYEDPQFLAILRLHRSRKMKSLVDAEMQLRGADRARILNEMTQACFNVTHDGDIQSFWLRYRDSDIAIANKARCRQHLAYKTVDAFVFPEFLSMPSTSSSDSASSSSSGSRHESRNTSEHHIVLFVAYPKLYEIWLYDSLLAIDIPAAVSRLRQCDYPTSSSESADAPYEQNKQKAFHVVESYMHALELVHLSDRTEPKSRKLVKRLSKVSKRSSFVPQGYNFVQVGYRNGYRQRTHECGLFAMMGMHDLLQKWTDKTRPHQMKLDPNRDMFKRCLITANQFSALTAINVIKKNILMWVAPNSPPSSVLLTCTSEDPADQEMVSVVKQIFARTKDYVLQKKDASPRTQIIETPSTELYPTVEKDALIWIVGRKPASRVCTKAFKTLFENHAAIRFCIAIYPGQAVHVLYRESKDSRTISTSSDTTLLYNLPIWTKEMSRSAVDTAATVSRTIFPHKASKHLTFTIDLPTLETTHVLWAAGAGYIPICVEDRIRRSTEDAKTEKSRVSGRSPVCPAFREGTT